MAAIVVPSNQRATRPRLEINWIPVLLIGALFVGAGLASWRITYQLIEAPPSLTSWLLVMGLSTFVLYTFTGFGVTMGYHRGFTHKSFKYPAWLRNLLLLGGGLSLEGDAINWVLTHRIHHAYADEWQDPHSPFIYAQAYPAGQEGVIAWKWWGKAIGFDRVTWWGLLRGLLWSHLLWMFVRRPLPERVPSVRDLEYYRSFRLQRDHYWVLAVGTFVLPTLIGAAYGLTSGTWMGLFWGAFDGLAIPGALRIFALLNFTWAINSVCHVIGHSAKDVEGNVYKMDLARDLGLLWALGSLGESKHAKHHADPSAADHGTKRTDIDPTKWAIWTLEHTGIVWDVKWHDPNRVFTKAQQTLPSLRRPADGEQA